MVLMALLICGTLGEWLYSLFNKVLSGRLISLSHFQSDGKLLQVEVLVRSAIQIWHLGTSRVLYTSHVN